MKHRTVILIFAILLTTILLIGCSARMAINDEPVPLASAEDVELTKLEAEAIALEHADIEPNHISFLYTKHKTEDGAPRYEVSFHKDTYRYEIHVHSMTGEILEYEMEPFGG